MAVEAGTCRSAVQRAARGGQGRRRPAPGWIPQGSHRCSGLGRRGLREAEEL